jgi:hypothetical protein
VAYPAFPSISITPRETETFLSQKIHLDSIYIKGIATEEAAKTADKCNFIW